MKNIHIETERLILRRFQEKDLDDLYEYLSDEEVVRFEPYRPMSLDEVRENLSWRIGAEEMIAVEDKATGKLLGNLYLAREKFETMELGYVFARAFWGKGYAKESCAALIDLCFQEGVHRIIARCDPLNPASWHLLEALGFRREAHLRENVYFWKDENGSPIWKDTYIYSKLNK